MGPTKVAKKIHLTNSSRPQKQSKSKDDVMKYFATILVYCLFYFIRSSRHWSEEEREQLNEVVKNYPCLYDTSTCKTYKDITVKTNAKVEISKLLESCSVEDVTVQWGSLVDKFRRTKKQYRGERG
jgi:hypothetical protein